MSFTVTTEPREDRQLAMIIEVSQERVDKELRKAATKVARQVRIPGFRTGKAPYHIVVQQYGLGNLYNEFIEDLGQDLFREALEESEITPYAQSALETIDLDPLRYTLIVPLEPEVTLGDYRDLRMEPKEAEIDDARIEERLDAYQEQYAGWQDVDRPSQYGDTMTIDVKSVLIALEGDEEGDEDAEETVVLDETDWDVTPDEENPMEPPGFDQELLGLRTGEEKEFVLAWPADSQSVYAGKQARFRVTVKGLQAYEKPALDDEFAKLVGPDYETLGDLKQSILESLQAEEQARLENEFVTEVLDALVEMSELDYPPAVIEDQIDGMVADTEQRLRQIGIDSLETFLRQTNQELDAYRNQMREDAEKIARRNLILSEIIKAENLSVSDDDIEAQIRRMIGEEGEGELSESTEAVANMLRQGAGRNMLVSQILTEKAIERVLAIVRGEEIPVLEVTEPDAEAEAVAEAELEAVVEAEAETLADTEPAAATDELGEDNRRKTAD